MRDTAIARASDDYYPRDPTSSGPHIGACVYNSLFLSGACVRACTPRVCACVCVGLCARVHERAACRAGGPPSRSTPPPSTHTHTQPGILSPDWDMFQSAHPAAALHAAARAVSGGAVYVSD